MPHERPRSAHHRRFDREWIAALQHALDQTLADRDDLRSARPDLTVIAADEAGLRFEAELRLRAGPFAYCCDEPGCHVAASTQRWWRAFRSDLAEVSDRTPPPMTLILHTAVEPGTLLTALHQLGINPPTSQGSSRTDTYAERDAK